jgi:hypothetical protein
MIHGTVFVVKDQSGRGKAMAAFLRCYGHDEIRQKVKGRERPVAIRVPVREDGKQDKNDIYVVALSAKIAEFAHLGHVFVEGFKRSHVLNNVPASANVKDLELPKEGAIEALMAAVREAGFGVTA